MTLTREEIEALADEYSHLATASSAMSGGRVDDVSRDTATALRQLLVEADAAREEGRRSGIKEAAEVAASRDARGLLHGPSAAILALLDPKEG